MGSCPLLFYLVGTSRLELLTPSVSRKCSSHLSYAPTPRGEVLSSENDPARQQIFSHFFCVFFSGCCGPRGGAVRSLPHPRRPGVRAQSPRKGPAPPPGCALSVVPPRPSTGPGWAARAAGGVAVPGFLPSLPMRGARRDVAPGCRDAGSSGNGSRPALRVAASVTPARRRSPSLTGPGPAARPRSSRAPGPSTGPCGPSCAPFRPVPASGRNGRWRAGNVWPVCAGG